MKDGFFFIKKLFIIVIKLNLICQPWNFWFDFLFNPGLKLIRIRVDYIWDPKTIGKKMIKFFFKTIHTHIFLLNQSGFCSLTYKTHYSDQELY